MVIYDVYETKAHGTSYVYHPGCFDGWRCYGTDHRFSSVIFHPDKMEKGCALQSILFLVVNSSEY